MDEIAQEDALIAQFAGVASVPTSEARQYLAANDWNLSAALTEFYTAQEENVTGRAPVPSSYDEDDEEEDDEATPPREPAPPGGGRRLGDAPSNPQPIPTTSSGPSQPKKKPAQQKKFATLGDFNSEGHGHDHDDGEDDDKQDLFAGGEKSGLAVQNPDDLKKKIIEKAMKSAKPRPKDDAKPQSSHFTGAARTLGGDDAPSRTIEPTPVSQRPRHGERVDRILHFWNDGFSVDDGDLYRTDDPRNAEILNGIRQGRAPLSIMNVMPGQEVDVEINQHQEDYVRPKKKWVPFGGHGNRLGSPTPGGAPSMPGAFTPTTFSSTPPPPPPSATNEAATTTTTTVVDVDDSRPVITLQIRLGSGTRLPARFNASHTIGDVYSFVAASSPESQSREWVLQTTFPTKELTDKAQVLGEMGDLKKGGVVIQKWK